MYSENFNLQLKNCCKLLAEDGYVLFSEVYDNSTYKSLLTTYEDKKNLLQQAQIGSGIERNKNLSVRSDKNKWISEQEVKFYALHDCLGKFLSLAKQELFLPVKRYEVQMALYPKGSFYARHCDQHRNNPWRLLSLVFYLNDWQKNDGGELVIYRPEKEKVVVAPIKNQLVIFRSELEHEVMPAKRERKSFSAWLRNDVL